MKVFDANNNLLGIFMSGNFIDTVTVFIPSINKIVVIQGTQVGLRDEFW